MELRNSFQRPDRIDAEAGSLRPDFGRFVAQPFERGFASTVGNAMRRCLLSSIEGAAITAVQIEGVPHEFSSIEGVVEDVTDIILNLKQVALRMHAEDARYLSVEASEGGAVTAAALEGDPQIEIANPDQHIATLNEHGKLKLQIRVEKARGYVSADQNVDESIGIGWIPLDSVHTPVRRVNYKVESARLGRATDYEKLTLEVWTNGTMTPDESIATAAEILQDHLLIFIEGSEVTGAEVEPEPEVDAELEALLDKALDEIDISARSTNCLKNANIHTLRDLVRKSERDILETKNFGKKSLEELQELLERLGLSFGMDVAEAPSESVASA